MVRLLPWGALLLLLYLLGSPRALTRDCVSNAVLSAVLLQHGRVSVTVERAPVLFRFMTPAGQLEEVTSAARLQAGGLRLTGPAYDLIETRWPQHYLNTFGLGTAVSALPAFVPLRLAFTNLLEHHQALLLAAKVAAALMALLSTAVVYLATRRLCQRPGLLALSYGLGTNVLCTASQALWQQGAAALYLALAAWQYLLLQEEPEGSRGADRKALWCGLALGAAAACRPTAVLVLAILAASLLGGAPRRWRSLAWLVSGAAPIALLLALYHTYYLGAPWRTGQYAVASAVALAKTGRAALWQTPLWEGAAGLLFSPGRGLLWYSPLFLMLALAALRRPGPLRRTAPLLLSVGALWLVAFQWFDWWGGWCYGPRPLLDSLPLLVIGLAPGWAWVAERRWRRGGFALLLAASVAAQAAGTYAAEPLRWNNRLAGFYVQRKGDASPVLVHSRAEYQQLLGADGSGGRVLGEVRLNIDLPEHRHRLWSLRDNPILYNLQHLRR